jgi:hypothetical protein
MTGKGADMFSDEFFDAIKADREREIKAAQRARLADRKPLNEEPEGAQSQANARSIRRIVRPSGQPGRTTADPSL